MAGSLVTSLHLVGGLLELSAATLRSSIRGGLTHDETNAGIARWAASVVREAKIDHTKIAEADNHLASRELRPLDKLESFPGSTVTHPANRAERTT